MNDELLALAERLSKFLAVLESARRCENKAISVWSDDIEIVSKSVSALRLSAATPGDAVREEAWRIAANECEDHALCDVPDDTTEEYDQGYSDGCNRCAELIRNLWLHKGEIIRDGDECLTDSHLGWQPAKHDIGGQVPDPTYTAHRMYRRLKEPRP